MNGMAENSRAWVLPSLDWREVFGVQCSAEFMIEPWEFGNLERVDTAVMTLAGHGLEVQVGPFGNTVQGEVEVVLPALVEMLESAFESGATTVMLQVTRSNA